MSKRKFSTFMRELEEEARTEGPGAVEELDAFKEHFKLAREFVAVRRDAGLTQRQLAERTGINQSEISDIERGQANPTYHTLQTLAKGLRARLTFVRAPRQPRKTKTRGRAPRSRAS
jgi:DNA-binding XRE family transcriptional regulator